MQTKAKLTSIGVFIAIAVTALALAIAPVGASSGNNFISGSPFSSPWWVFPFGSDTFVADNYSKMEVENKNIAKVDTTTNQTAVTGGISLSMVDDQTGGAATGPVANANAAGTAISATNALTMPEMPVEVAPMVLPDPSAFDDFDHVRLENTNKVELTNKNVVKVNTHTNQTAVSGDINATLSDDIEGTLSTGAASNQNTVTTVISLSN